MYTKNKKIARKYVLCISIARYTIVCTDTWYCKKVKIILICVPLPKGKRAKILDTSLAVSTMC